MSAARADGAGVRSAATGALWEPVIGLEVHCQLGTESKLFCGCANAFGAPPNTLTCPTCTAQPGALPVLNRAALALGVRAALVLGAEIARESRFDRKSYFYCDLPKGYQISQLHRPLCSGGGLELRSGKRVRLTRIHLEEDAGKAIHDRGAETLVDLNRAGVPLIEAVTEADLSSAEEAGEFLGRLKEILQYAGVSDCDMEKGSLRCDVNVSVHRPGEPWRSKVELKNLNSFRNVRAAIELEVARQIRAWEDPDPARHPVQETRLFDPERGETRPMRSKEDAHDYRYFPDPDLPPVLVDEAFVAAQRALLPELPEARRRRYVEQLGLSEYDAGVLTGSRAVADFFEQAVQRGAEPKEAANWIANDLLAAVGDAALPGASLAELRIDAVGLAELLALVSGGTLHKSGARRVLRAMLETGRPARELQRELGLEPVSDEAELVAWCRAALAANAGAAADVRAGKAKALGALVGPVMKASAGRANPERVRALLLRLVAEG